MANRILMTGNEAAGEAAIRADCTAYYGYPITPQNELTGYMSEKMPRIGRIFLQAESELAAINMVLGTSATGKRTMTSSSSPGMSLKQEGISYIAALELPAVIVNVQRGGPGLGNIAPAQGDYWQATRGGGHGDYRTIVLAPHTVQEMFDLVFKAFDLADEYRIPVIVLSDGRIGQMMEPVTIPQDLKPIEVDKPWALNGAGGRRGQRLCSLLLSEDRLEELNERLQKNYAKIETDEVSYEETLTEDAEIVLVAYGTCARLCREVIRTMRKDGVKLGLIRPITLWPYPAQPIKSAAARGSKFLVVEMSCGQMIEDVKLSLDAPATVEFYGRSGGNVPTCDAIIQKIQSMLNG